MLQAMHACMGEAEPKDGDDTTKIVNRFGPRPWALKSRLTLQPFYKTATLWSARYHWKLRSLRAEAARRVARMAGVRRSTAARKAHERERTMRIAAVVVVAGGSATTTTITATTMTVLAVGVAVVGGEAKRMTRIAVTADRLSGLVAKTAPPRALRVVAVQVAAATGRAVAHQGTGGGGGRAAAPESAGAAAAAAAGGAAGPGPGRGLHRGGEAAAARGHRSASAVAARSVAGDARTTKRTLGRMRALATCGAS